jgi:hypothetical protein
VGANKRRARIFFGHAELLLLSYAMDVLVSEAPIDIERYNTVALINRKISRGICATKNKEATS